MNILSTLAAMADKIRPGSSKWLQLKSVPQSQIVEKLAGIIVGAGGKLPDGFVRSPLATRTTHNQPLAADAMVSVRESDLREILNGLTILERRLSTPAGVTTPPAMSVSPGNLLAEYTRLVSSKDPADHSRAADLYLKDPQAFLEQCQAGPRVTSETRHAEAQAKLAGEMRKVGYKL
ncbi:MAG: hypothetical protein WAO02_14815 [Verrucomicrobiia bacterium]